MLSLTWDPSTSHVTSFSAFKGRLVMTQTLPFPYKRVLSKAFILNWNSLANPYPFLILMSKGANPHELGQVNSHVFTWLLLLLFA